MIRPTDISLGTWDALRGAASLLSDERLRGVGPEVAKEVTLEAVITIYRAAVRDAISFLSTP